MCLLDLFFDHRWTWTEGVGWIAVLPLLRLDKY